MHAEFTFPLTLIFGFLAVLARVAGALAFIPIPGVRNAPEPVRAVLALSMTVALAPLWPAVGPEQFTAGRVLGLVCSESTLGITIGLAVSFLLEGLLVAGQVFGVQAGYSYASTIDPTTEADSNVLIVFAQLLGGLLFFALGLDRQVLSIFAGSLASYPPGTFLIKPATAGVIIRMSADMLTTGVRLALPVVVLLMLVDVALALLARMHQQLQLITLAFPAKMMLTLVFLATISTLFLPVFRGAAEHTLSALARLF